MNNIKTKILLITSGLILLSVGLSILFLPHAFYQSNGTILGNEPSLLSEIRAGGGMLLVSGILVIIDTFRKSLHRQALALSALVFLAYGVARLASMVMDGIPSTSLVISTGIELLVGTLCLIVLLKNNQYRLY